MEGNQDLPVELPTAAGEPLNGADKVTADGGVLIQMLEEGEGELPPLHARCLGTQLANETSRDAT